LRQQRPFVTIGLLVWLGSGCSTTTIGRRDTPETRQWLRERESSRAEVSVRRDPSGGANVDGVLIQSSSPTDIRFSSPTSGVIPLEDVERVTIVERGRGAAYGTLIGAAAGILAGLSLALSQGDDRSSDCGYPCRSSDRAVFWGGIFGGLGMLGGAATGALLGHRDILLLNDGKEGK
jgi:hypothetical protein